MSNFRTKLLGLAVLGASMAGTSYGAQAVLNCGGVQLANITAVLRAEGQTELVQDVVGTACTLPAGVTVTNGSFTVNVSATPETNNALLSVTTDTEGGGTKYYLGTVSGTVINFGSIAFPAAPTNFDFHVYNIRVNASTAPLNSYVTESGTIQYTTASSVTGEAILSVYGGLQVGYTQTSLAVSVDPTFRNYFTCKGDPLVGNALPPSSFKIDVNETTPGAFKVQGAAYNSGVAGENGSSFILGTVNANAPGGVTVPVSGAANNPTQLTVTLGNIPAGSTVYLPINISATPNNVGPEDSCSNVAGPCNVTTLTLEGATAATSGGVPLTDNPNGPVAGYAPNAAGTITVTYAVTQAWISGTLQFPIPVYVTFAPNSTTAQGPFTASVAYAPAVAPLTGPPTTIPTFALGGKPLNASIISFCQTTLLFPYVTNAQGYETGVAIANTSTDNLNPGGASFGPAVPGTCSVNFYGDAAQPKAVTFPKTGMLGAYNATTGQAPIYADVLTDLITVSGFTGYAIANCNFLDAHGYAIIVDANTGTGSGQYLALVIPRNTTVGVGADAGPTGEGDAN